MLTVPAVTMRVMVRDEVCSEEDARELAQLSEQIVRRACENAVAQKGKPVAMIRGFVYALLIEGFAAGAIWGAWELWKIL